MSKSKRPTVDLLAITAEAAAPMPGASQRTAAPAPIPALPKELTDAAQVRTPELMPLSFKVPPSFGRRFKICAAKADLKHNELLFAALDAWEEKHGETK